MRRKRKAAADEGGGPPAWQALLAGVVASLPFQKHAPGPLVLFALVPLFLLLRAQGRERGPLAGLRTGWLFGFGFFLSLLYWIGLLSQTEIPIRALALVGLFVLAAYLALFPALFGLAFRVLDGRVPLLLFAPVVWGATEHLRSLGTLGFPWGALGYALSEQPALVQIARFGSVDAVTLFVVAVNALFAEGLLGIAERNVRISAMRFLGAMLLILLVGADGIRAIRGGFDASGPPVRVAVVQPNIPANDKWTEAYKDESLRILSDITREAAAAESDLDLIVWPETAVPVYVRHEQKYFKQIFDLVDEVQVPILFGYPDAEYDAKTGYEYYNAAMLIGADGHIRGEYRKIHLVPFGERLPLTERLRVIAEMNLGEADFTPGAEHTVFREGGTEFSANICFESIFPPLCRGFVLGGARFLVNLTNDAWFGTTSAPGQHAAMARLRCVELGVFLARSANTGISLVADPFGRVVKSLGLFETGYVAADLTPTTADTFYVRHGDWLPRFEIALAGAFLVAALVRRGRSGPG